MNVPVLRRDLIRIIWSLKTTICRMLKQSNAPDISCLHVHISGWAVALLKHCNAYMTSGAEN
eukprot:478583-Pelagomonas_calceolata.AAC.5